MKIPLGYQKKIANMIESVLQEYNLSEIPNRECVTRQAMAELILEKVKKEFGLK